MNGVSGPANNYGLLGVLIGDSGAVRQRLNTLTQQAGDGYVSDTYAGLGAQNARTALSLSPQIAHATSLAAGIGAATSRMAVAQGALSSISDIASSFYSQTLTLGSLNPANIDNVASAARGALAQVASLLDTKDGDTYVFAGQDSSNPPVPDPDQIGSSGFATQIAGAGAGLATNGAAATIATTLAVGQSNAPGTSPFSPALSQPAAGLAALRTSVGTGEGARQATGILASGNAVATSSGGSTTGSYTRDILRGLATLAGLSSAQQGAAGFAALVSDVHTALGGAVTALNQDAGIMGDQQTALATTQTHIGEAATTLKSQLSGAQEVDMAQTLSSITATQSQLQASYQLIAGMQSLSLVKYLG